MMLYDDRVVQTASPTGVFFWRRELLRKLGASLRDDQAPIAASAGMQLHDRRGVKRAIDFLPHTHQRSFVMRNLFAERRTHGFS